MKKAPPKDGVVLTGGIWICPRQRELCGQRLQAKLLEHAWERSAGFGVLGMCKGRGERQARWVERLERYLSVRVSCSSDTLLAGSSSLRLIQA